MKSTDGFTYKGVFADGKRQGAGKLSITDGTYSFDGMFANDDPQNFANEVQFELISPQLEVKQAAVDPKAKGGKGPADTKDAIFTEEEETTYGHRKIYLEYKPDAEEQQEVAFNIKILFQGPEYEDPNPPKEEEVAKKPLAKGKQAAEIVASTP
jgi:hypothetical protein